MELQFGRLTSIPVCMMQIKWHKVPYIKEYSTLLLPLESCFAFYEIKRNIMHFLSADQFDLETLNSFFQSIAQKKYAEMQDKIMANLFLEPSLRTRFSFEIAMKKLGGEVVSSTNAQELSIAKGESIEDTMRVLSELVDIIVLRHPEEGMVAKAAQASLVPVINAGDGLGEHPTQALLDMYTIQQKFIMDKGLTILMCGDLLYSRTAHSLIKLLNLYPNVKFKFFSPEALELYKHQTPKDSVILQEWDLDGVDVVYMTRLQRERIPSRQWGSPTTDEWMRMQREYDKCRFMVKHLDELHEDAIILHPLPKNEEIEEGVDLDPRALYFRKQIRNGLDVRITLLHAMLSGKNIFKV